MKRVLILTAAVLGMSAALPTASAQSLEVALQEAVVSRVENPIVFSTRDTLFALSLPTDEEPEIYLHITVGKNGKVKEKMTRVNANHIGANVAPAFVEATKELRIDRALLAGMSGPDTAVMVTIPLDYQCVLDTVSRAWPDSEAKLQKILHAPYLYYNGVFAVTPKRREKDMQDWTDWAFYSSKSEYYDSEPTPIWYYLTFIDLPHSEK